MMRRQLTICLLALLVLTMTASCGFGGDSQREEGLFYDAAGISPDEPLLTVDGREVPAWRYLYWLTCTCDFIRDSYESAGQTLDWSEPLSGGTLADYAKQQALSSTALYATVENWAEQYEISLTEEDREALETDWTEKAASYGGEEAYLAVLANLGLTRADAQALSADHYLYKELYTHAQSQESPLHPQEGELAAFAEEKGYLCVDMILISTADVAQDDAEGMAQCRERAESVFSQLNASEDPAGTFAALAQSSSDDADRAAYPEGRTFLPGAGVLPAGAEEAAMALEEGQWSGIVETEEGFYILLRKPVDLEAVAGDYFDSLLQQAADQAEIRLTEAYDTIGTGEFYERLTIARQASETTAPQDTEN